MKKSKKDKTFFKSKFLIFVIVAFMSAPLFINVGLIIADIIYEKTGIILTASGLSNVQWLDFWKEYLTITISFLGIYLVYISSKKDRESQLKERNAQQYLEDVKREENILVEVTQSFDTGVVYEALLQREYCNPEAGEKLLADSRNNMDSAHIKFELLTDLCDDFERCKNCSSPCVDKSIMVELRDLFYNMEKKYVDMLGLAENLIQQLNQEIKFVNLLNIQNALYSNTYEITELYEKRGLKDEATASKIELENIKKEIKNLEKTKQELAQKTESLEKIQKEKGHIENEMRPKFIKYCKTYIDIKKHYAIELRTTGCIKKVKLNKEDNSIK